MRKSKIRSFPETCRSENSYGDIDLELGKKDLEQLEITAKTDFGEIDVPDDHGRISMQEEDWTSRAFLMYRISQRAV